MHIDFDLSDVARAALAERYRLDRAARRIEGKLAELDVDASIALDFAALAQTPQGFEIAIGVAFRMTHKDAASPVDGRVVLRDVAASIEVALATVVSGAADALLGACAFGRAA
ncbi:MULTISPECIES: hypothetical protein [unclassified Mesorhizobium]|uniref:hypothetical protein n=1 Tax=unclassified Mesorhizobium TaxID=325217 RepID=UPI000FCA52E0|nr:MULTISPECIES: hypothetical protein [unclassified Mesorhizobium]TGU56910.1 hypothetical protein EN791_029700 [Mesorhizobium sp. M2D.F.Ca.ET.148.01.1.1]TGU61291.1 hypothetical protein EN790_29720 [Mesorhizobium sp. M2D.F.Ca.ET.147.01.1.1]